MSKRSREIDRLKDVIDRGAKAWLSLDPGIAWEGDLGDAMQAAVEEIGRLRAGETVDKELSDEIRDWLTTNNEPPS